jgi:hypothetical protein
VVRHDFISVDPNIIFGRRPAKGIRMGWSRSPNASLNADSGWLSISGFAERLLPGGDPW